MYKLAISNGYEGRNLYIEKQILISFSNLFISYLKIYRHLKVFSVHIH